MEIFQNEFIVVLVLFLMLLGAYLIGRSASSIKEPPKKTSSKKFDQSNMLDTEELTDYIQPGQIRARQTRDRTGELIDPRLSTDDTTTFQDFPLGKGNAQNADDLKKITGIGPAIENKLNSIGIFQFEQLASMTDDQEKEITELIAFFPGRIKRDNWKQQAQELLK